MGAVNNYVSASKSFDWMAVADAEDEAKKP